MDRVNHFLVTGDKRQLQTNFMCSMNGVAGACCENSGMGPRCYDCSSPTSGSNPCAAEDYGTTSCQSLATGNGITSYCGTLHNCAATTENTANKPIRMYFPITGRSSTPGTTDKIVLWTESAANALFFSNNPEPNVACKLFAFALDSCGYFEPS